MSKPYLSLCDYFGHILIVIYSLSLQLCRKYVCPSQRHGTITLLYCLTKIDITLKL